MSDIVTPQAVERRLVALSQENDKAHDMLAEAERKAVEAKIDYDLGLAKVRQAIRSKAQLESVKMTVGEIDDAALLECDKEYTAHLTTESVLRVARSNVARVKIQTDIARSVGTSVRTSIDLA